MAAGLVPTRTMAQKSTSTSSRSMTGIIWPVNATRVTQTPFEPGTTHAHEYAYDIALPAGSPVRAAGRAGERLKVVQVRVDPKTYGLNVILQSPRGIFIREAHLSSAGVTPGQTIQAGQVIGLSGGAKDNPLSGNSSGPHLHVGFFGAAKDLLASYVGTPEMAISPTSSSYNKPVQIPNAPRELSILSPSGQGISAKSVQLASPATSVQLTGDVRQLKEVPPLMAPAPTGSIVQWGSVGMPGGTKPDAAKQAAGDQAASAEQPQGIKLFEYSLLPGVKGSFTIPTRPGGPQSAKDLVAIAAGAVIAIGSLMAISRAMSKRSPGNAYYGFQKRVAGKLAGAVTGKVTSAAKRAAAG